MSKSLLFALLALAIPLVLGCELVDQDSSKATTPEAAAATTDAPAAAPSTSSSGFNFSTVSWLGPAYPGTVRDERASLQSASIDRGSNTIRLSYNPLPSDWPKQVNAPGQLVMFEQLGDGSWRGGRVEWIDPGQSVKSLNNISNGYNGWRLPPAGARMAIAILSSNGRYNAGVVFANY